MFIQLIQHFIIKILPNSYSTHCSRMSKENGHACLSCIRILYKFIFPHLCTYARWRPPLPLELPDSESAAWAIFSFLLSYR